MALINTTTTGVLGTTVYGDGAGALTVQKDGVTQGIYGNIPTFSAYKTSTQTFSSSTWTKVTFDTEEYDTNSNYDTSTSRFTPTVAGYYQVNAQLDIYAGGSSITNTLISVYKNGTGHKRGYGASATSAETYAPAAALIYMNGTTDYIEVYVNATTGGTPGIYAGAPATSYFQAILVKAA
jgi:hypothetical protein